MKGVFGRHASLAPCNAFTPLAFRRDLTFTDTTQPIFLKYGLGTNCCFGGSYFDDIVSPVMNGSHGWKRPLGEVGEGGNAQHMIFFGYCPALCQKAGSRSKPLQEHGGEDVRAN